MLTHDFFELDLSLETPDSQDWQRLMGYLPPDLEESARRYGAIRRQSGVMRDAGTLLRLLLATACGQSLDTIAGRAVELGLVPHLTDSALSHRFQALVPWLGYLVGQQLAGAQTAFPWEKPLRIRLLDASTLQRPGTTGTDWRLHLGLDLRTGLIDHLSVTGDNIGERLADLPVGPGDVVIADRAYATRAGITAVTDKQADVLVRMTWQNLPLQHRDGRPFVIEEAMAHLQPGEQGCWEVQTAPTKAFPAIAGRLVVQALPPAQVEQAHRRLIREGRNAGKTPSAQTLHASGYVLVFTTVPATLLTPAEVLALYRMRWQVEITFKRSKSALQLADIRASSDKGCYAVLLGKCLLLLLIERLARATGLFSPSGTIARADESISLLPRNIFDRENAHLTPAGHSRLALTPEDQTDDLFFGTPPSATTVTV